MSPTLAPLALTALAIAGLGMAVMSCTLAHDTWRQGFPMCSLGWVATAVAGWALCFSAVFQIGA